MIVSPEVIVEAAGPLGDAPSRPIKAFYNLCGYDPSEESPILLSWIGDFFLSGGLPKMATCSESKQFTVCTIHEVLIIPDDGHQDYHELEAMVQSINQAEVAPADRLSDHVYHYDQADRVFELAEKTAGRKLEQKLARKAEQIDPEEKKTSVLAQLGEKKKEAMEHAPKAKAAGRTIPEAAL